MYLSADDARSDFFLAAATYLLGGLLLSFLFEILGGLMNNSIALWIETVAAQLLIIAAMPLYLMRYRGEPWSLLWSGSRSAPIGLAFGGVIAVGAIAGTVIGGGDPVQALPVTNPSRLLFGRIAQWLSLAVLTVFLYRRAEYAFRPISERHATLARYAAIASLGTAAGASILLLPTGASLGILGAPLGFVGAFALAMRLVPPTGMSERWQIWSPLIVLAVGEVSPFAILGDGTRFVVQARTGGMLAAFGLLSLMVLGARRGGAATFAMAAVIALATGVTAFGTGA